MTSRRPQRIAGLALVAALAATACGGADEGAGTDSAATSTVSETSETAEASETTEATTASDPATGDSTPGSEQPAATTGGDVEVPEVLQVSAPLVGGGDLDLAGFAGRPVALWFWAPG